MKKKITIVTEIYEFQYSSINNLQYFTARKILISFLS